VNLSSAKKYFGRVFDLFETNAEPMGIDKEIKQATFRNNQNKAMVNIMFTHAWMVDHIKSFVKSENITPQQYNILRILRGAGEPLSTLQLRERMLDKMSDTSRIVERMVSKNLVQKAVSEKDKRMVDVIITPQGSELLENLDRRNEELDAVVNHLSDDELETLNNLLDKLRNNH
jgi:DNA-binding MarR family transcriptional regulator